VNSNQSRPFGVLVDTRLPVEQSIWRTPLQIINEDVLSVNIPLCTCDFVLKWNGHGFTAFHASECPAFRNTEASEASE
jgi:hypothetical protein